MQVAWTEIEWDFLLDKQNYTKNELQRRFQRGGRLWFSKDGNGATLPDCNDGSTPLQEFGGRLNNMRSFVCDLSKPRLNEAFENRIQSLDNAFDCKTFEDCLRLIRSSLEMTKELRNFIFNLETNFWGKNLAKDIEIIVMKKLKLKYINLLVDTKESEKIPKTRRTSGSIAKMINRLKQTNFIERLR